MPRSCCVVMCGHGSKYCKMKRFPSDLKRAAVWQSNVGRPNWERSESSVVCECHFDATQFELNRQDGAKKLRHDAVPLIFPTHVLVVHDPTGEKKWLSPEPRPHPSQLQRNPLRPSLQYKKQGTALTTSPSYKKQSKTKTSRVYKKKARKADHMYAKGSANDDSQGATMMCDSFCPEDEFDKLGMLDTSPPRTNEVLQPIQNGSYGGKHLPNKPAGPNISSRSRTSPPFKSNLPEGQNKVCLSQSSTVAQLQRIPISLQAKSPQYSPTSPLKTPDAHSGNQSSLYKTQDLSQGSIEILDIHSEGDSVVDSETDFPTNQLGTPKSRDEDLNGSTGVPPEVLKDALSFLQFMLPQKWLAFSENSGIHVSLLSRSKAKSIQRSVFVPFNGGKIELYVHAKKLSRDHEIFESASFKEREPLTQDSLGSVVDRIVNVIQLFSSYEVCCGVTDREYLLVWRKFTDCMLDCNSFGEEKYDQTVRSIACAFLAPKDSIRCKKCDTLYE